MVWIVGGSEWLSAWTQGVVFMTICVMIDNLYLFALVKDMELHVGFDSYVRFALGGSSMSTEIFLGSLKLFLAHVLDKKACSA